MGEGGFPNSETMLVGASSSRSNLSSFANQDSMKFIDLSLSMSSISKDPRERSERLDNDRRSST